MTAMRWREQRALLLAMVLVAGAAFGAGACGDSGGGAEGDTGVPGFETVGGGEDADDGGGDAAATGGADDDDAGPMGGDDTSPDVPDPVDETCPPGQVVLTFAVDDSANQTYSDGELLWTGSFAHDAATNTLAFASSWLPEEGPYPLLWDDGPISDGGHEPEGAAAGDHVFGAAVCYLAEQDRVFAYGALNADLRWIWVGPNGQIEIPAGTTGRIDFPGLALEPFGDRDFKVFLDTGALHESFATVSLDSHGVYVKGTMNSWSPIQLLDDGQLGDEAAGDGVVTYHHGLLLGPHDGLLQPGQEAQFVFVFAKGEGDPDEGLEYKVQGDAEAEGVSAEGECAAGWQPLEVIQSLDSKGVELNTAIVICDDGPIVPDPECDDAHPCELGLLCEAGECVPEDTGPECDAETPCPEPDAICIDGACVVPEVECDDELPCPGEGEVCDQGTCVVPGGKPELLLIVPDTGSTFGGTEVTLTGQGFVDGLIVTFDAAVATVQSVSPSQAVVLTPPHALGAVDVTVTVPGGEYATYPSGFVYVETASAPSISSLQPAQGASGGGTTVTITGANFVAPVTVLFGTLTAPSAEVSAGGDTITTITPASPVGSVQVTVLNGDGQEASKDQAFSFVPELPDWGQLDGPASLDTVEGKPTAKLSAQVFEPGVTDSPGAGFGITAEVGYGPAGSDPTGDATWTWVAAQYSGDVGNNDAYAGGVSPPLGTWSATLRFSVSGGQSWLYVDLGGADDGFDPADVATVTVEEAGAVVLLDLDPASLWPGGGQAVVVSGVGLAAGCAVTLGGDAIEASVDAGAGTLSFVAPPHPPGDVAVEATCPDGADTISASYAVVWDGQLDEWPESALLASSTLASDWGEDNVLEALYADTDGENLYVGVAGHADGGGFGQNALVVFVDLDYGAGTGVQATADIVDGDGAVDAALGGAVSFGDSGFGADAALATLNMATYHPAIEDPSTVAAGWRGLDDPSNLPWLLSGAVYASAGAVEAVIPLADLDAGGWPASWGFVARITNADGDYTANQSLPEGVSGAASEVSDSAATLTVDAP